MRRGSRRHLLRTRRRALGEYTPVVICNDRRTETSARNGIAETIVVRDDANDECWQRSNGRGCARCDCISGGTRIRLMIVLRSDKGACQICASHLANDYVDCAWRTAVKRGRQRCDTRRTVLQVPMREPFQRGRILERRDILDEMSPAIRDDIRDSRSARTARGLRDPMNRAVLSRRDGRGG